MSRTPLTSLAAATGIALLLSLSGCSLINFAGSGGQSGTSDQTQTEESALEAYAAAERAALPSVMDQNPGVFSDIIVEIEEPGSLIFTYTYAEAMDVATTASNLDGLVDQLQQSCDDQVFPAMDAAGVPDPKSVTYVYLDSDGSQIWTHTFSPS